PQRILTGTTRMVLGAVQLGGSIFRGHHHRVQAWCQMARGAGLLAGLMGWHPAEYQSSRRDHAAGPT
ncbi:MAG TPA: hypothetical protein VIY86_09915, partial [Pirellulaceae bacterium]